MGKQTKGEGDTRVIFSKEQEFLNSTDLKFVNQSINGRLT